jgi:hypothetical protein
LLAVLLGRGATPVASIDQCRTLVNEYYILAIAKEILRRSDNGAEMPRCGNIC